MMTEKNHGQLWILGPGTRQEDLPLELTRASQLCFRGTLPEDLVLNFAGKADLNRVFSEDTHEPIWQDIENGRDVFYYSPIPLHFDQAALRLLESKPARVHHLPAEQMPAINLPDELASKLKDGLVTLDGAALKGRHYPPFPPTITAMIYAPLSALGVEELIGMLLQVYESSHQIYTLASFFPGQNWQSLTLAEWDPKATSIVLIPPRSKDSSLESFADVIARLRAPDGCPWDRKQTHRSLRTYLLEETYEALAALDKEDMPGLSEELGDLLLQILLHAQIAEEKGEFNLSRILEGINRKIVFRHPHVFGDVNVQNDQDVLQNWEKLKEKERGENGNGSENGILKGVPVSFPALAQAQSIQDRAARVGFDWADIAPVKAKVLEELDEVYTAADETQRAKELGDLLFAVVNLVRWYKVDAESVLRETNLKFRTRFAYIEQKARENGKGLQEMTLEEMDAFWEEAKQFDD